MLGPLGDVRIRLAERGSGNPRDRDSGHAYHGVSHHGGVGVFEVLRPIPSMALVPSEIGFFRQGVAPASGDSTPRQVHGRGHDVVELSHRDAFRRRRVVASFDDGLDDGSGGGLYSQPSQPCRISAGCWFGLGASVESTVHFDMPTRLPHLARRAPCSEAESCAQRSIARRAVHRV